MKNHINIIDPRKYEPCSACGKKFTLLNLIEYSSSSIKSWIDLLENMLYGDRMAYHAFICRPCSVKLKAGNVPKFALCKGFCYLRNIPDVIQKLNKYESMLLALRLPCIFVWRSQGEFGQYASVGSPVAFSNPVAQIADSLPRNPNVVFKHILDNGKKIIIRVEVIQKALTWLCKHNELYSDVVINNKMFQTISDNFKGSNTNEDNKIDEVNKEVISSEKNHGAQGPLDEEALSYSLPLQNIGSEDVENHEEMKILLSHMLKPFKYRKSDLIPSYDATENLESYFPTLFPYGVGGPKSVNMQFATWVRHVLENDEFNFHKNLEFIFFCNSISQRRRITGLTMNAHIKNKCSNALIEVKSLLSSDISKQSIVRRIEKLLRSGVLSVSYEQLRGSPAYWAGMSKKAWTYLTVFGPCNIFLTMSAADLTDPLVFMCADSNLSFTEAKNLSPKQRANILANNPVAANEIFHKRINSLFDTFLFGNTKPFGEIEAYLGRIEAQSRHSPHIHLLIWLKNKPPKKNSDELYDVRELTNYLEMFSTSLQTEGELFNSSVSDNYYQKTPIPTYEPNRTCQQSSNLSISGNTRHNILTQSYISNMFDRSNENNKRISDIMLATQFHKCNNYCKSQRNTCRFGFPFPVQERATVSYQMHGESGRRMLCLSPRSSPHINSTHPILSAMCRSNTDVTIILGQGIAESMYVCNYAVKADKQDCFNKKSLHQLYKAFEDGKDDRSILSLIARGSVSAKIIGAQEAVSNLVGTPLCFESANILNVSISMFLDHENALSSNQRVNFNRSKQQELFTENVLTSCDPDTNVSVYDKNSYQNKNSYSKEFFSLYMKRPSKLSNMTAFDFHVNYKVQRLGKRKKLDTDMIIKIENDDRIVIKRRQICNRPHMQNILNVVDKGSADNSSPYFAASALALHVPFRSIEQLLNGSTLTERMKTLLNSCDNKALKNYVSNCHDISSRKDSSSSTVQSECISHDDINAAHDTENNGTDFSFENIEEIDYSQIDDTLNTKLKITKPWNNSSNLPSNRNLRIEQFREYLNACKTRGVQYANQILEENLEEQETIDVHDQQLEIDQYSILQTKKQILGKAKNNEQKSWLKFVLNYLQIYYSSSDENVPSTIIDVCKKNHPIFTSAPGGCGKSWLISMVINFVKKCIKPNQIPISLSENSALSIDDDFEITIERDQNGRFGRVLVLAPSGISAANCGGFTFHNALSTHRITLQELNVPLSEKRRKK